MFDLANWQNSETLMLNITNALLGLAAIVLIAWIAVEGIHEHFADAKHTKH